MKIQMIQTIKMQLKNQKYEESGRGFKLPFSREQLENVLNHICSEQWIGLTPKVSEEI